jgi:hypothetical protein
MIHFSESNDVASFVICWSAFEDSISIVGLCPKSPEASHMRQVNFDTNLSYYACPIGYHNYNKMQSSSSMSCLAG